MRPESSALPFTVRVRITKCLGFLLLMVSLQSCFEYAKTIKKQSQLFEEKYDEPYRFIETQGHSIRYARVGKADAPVVVLVHGSPGGMDNYFHLANEDSLADRFQFILYDRPGFMGSSKNGHEAELEKQAAIIADILDWENITQPIVLGGHSYGGPVVVRFGMDYPERTQGLIIMAGSVDPEQEKIKWFNKVATWRVVQWIIPHFFTISNREIMPLKGELEEMIPLWDRLTMPVIIFHGTKDNLVPFENVAFVKSKLPNPPLRSIELEGEDHFVIWSHPHYIVEAIEDILQANKRIER